MFYPSLLKPYIRELFTPTNYRLQNLRKFTISRLIFLTIGIQNQIKENKENPVKLKLKLSRFCVI